MAPAEDSLAPFDISGKSGNSADLQQIVRTDILEFMTEFPVKLMQCVTSFIAGNRYKGKEKNYLGILLEN